MTDPLSLGIYLPAGKLAETQVGLSVYAESVERRRSGWKG